MPNSELIFKIIDRRRWATAVADGRFEGAEVDLKDGFIHFSAAGQVAETAAKHFTGQSNLVLVAVDVAVLGNDLQWEVSRNGQRFPHLYATLDPAVVCFAKELPLDDSGIHQFPALNGE